MLGSTVNKTVNNTILFQSEASLSAELLSNHSSVHGEKWADVQFIFQPNGPRKGLLFFKRSHSHTCVEEKAFYVPGGPQDLVASYVDPRRTRGMFFGALCEPGVRRPTALCAVLRVRARKAPATNR